MNWKTDALCRIATALVVLVVGGAVALACANGDWGLWRAAWKTTRWDHSFVTGAEILVALVTAFGLASLLRPLFRGPLHLIGFWLGKALAFFPVTFLAWGFLGWWIGQHGYPVWTLMPATDSSGVEDWAARLWTWVPAVALLIVPLTGQCLSLSLEKSPRARDAGLSMLGLLALGLIVPIEDILGIEGAGSTLARTLRQPPNALADASAVWTLTGTAMYLAVCFHMPARIWPDRPAGTAEWVRSILSACLKLSAWLYLGHSLLLCLSGEYRDTVGSAELFAAFNQPSGILGLGAAIMVHSLPLWALGHIIRPRPKTLSSPSSHG